jgi:hypothetical protein
MQFWTLRLRSHWSSTIAVAGSARRKQASDHSHWCPATATYKLFYVFYMDATNHHTRLPPLPLDVLRIGVAATEHQCLSLASNTMTRQLPVAEFGHSFVIVSEASNSHWCSQTATFIARSRIRRLTMDLRISNTYGSLTRNKFLTISVTTLKYHEVYSKYASLPKFQIGVCWLVKIHFDKRMNWTYEIDIWFQE